ncbi:GATA zinc finger domain-containing protein 14-like isoform X2 [Ceratina calcarata]|uniref:GATA zinc finger domain-containing protein 14-like isoform X2 n=1 Tax=Ceratina calcarata TaxID=156304 RepID=A0AAJ7JFB3_9HYME|nr:GATA zinc finger domain-containing protein 14-like isoform X2 [Ceratina calcarata]
MDTTDRDFKKAADIEQTALIGKMHKMQWLKSNSQLSGQKVHPGKELISGTVVSTINEGTKEESEVASVNVCSSSAELRKIDSVLDKSINEDNSVLNKEPAELSLSTGECSGSMDTVWNKDVNATNQVLKVPNPQTLALERVDEKKVIDVSEDIVNVQLEHLRLEEKENKSDKLDNEAESYWNHLNVSDLSKSDNSINNQMNPKQCHDNNNNNAKSKSQSPLEAKKSIQKTTTKVNINRRISDPKIKKPTAVTGSSLKESGISLKQGSKSKDDLLSNDDGTTSTDSKKISVGITPKPSDKKVNGCNKNLIVVKETRTKEQQFSRQHTSTLGDTPNKRRPSMEKDDKTKSLTPSATKLKPMRSESDKRSSETADESKCHKVQVMRTQSYNVQYYRNKPVIKPPRYVRNAAKPEEDTSVQGSPGFNNNNVPTENATKKKFESQQSSINKQVSDTQSNQTTSGKNARNSNVSEYNSNDRSLAKTSSAPCKRSYQNLTTIRYSTDRNFKDDQTSYQKFKKDSNVYRRSSSNFQMSKDEKTDEQKRNVNTGNNLTKDHGVNRLSSGDPKGRSQPDGSRLTVHPHRTNDGASNTTKTDTSESIAVNNVQSAKPLNFSNGTKDSTTRNTSTPQDGSQALRSCNETEVQFLKTEQEDTSNNNTNDKTSASSSETKSVKFSDNIQEIAVSTYHPAMSYSNSAVNQSKLPASPFYPDVQTASNAQQIENHQSVQNKTYFDDNNAQYNKNCTDVRSIERDLHMLNLAQQKADKNSQIPSSQSVLPPSSSLNYQSLPAMYLNEHSNAQTVPRKTAESTIVSQSTLIPSTSSYAADTQNMTQTDPSNLLMHNTQTSVLPPSGFPCTAQPNQWNFPVTDMYLVGNMMNPALPFQNSRHACNADYSNMQQPGYVHPMFYMPPLCMQSWNPLLHYPAPLFQNTPYTNAFSNQVLPTNNLTEYMNCAPPTSMQNVPYKPYQQMQSLENAPNFTVPMKLDNYMGSAQGSKSNGRMKDNDNGDYQMRASQYRVPMSNEYQNCSQDGQLISYAIMDSVARNVPASVHVNQKYSPCTPTTANYSRMPDMYHSNRDASSGRQDDSECAQPMISPKDVMNMNYGINYSRKTDNVQNSYGRAEKSAAPIYFANMHHYTPHYQKNATYHQASPKEPSSRLNVGRGMRKMDQ